ncbi:MAG TPA: glycosyltransferase family 2 protein [Burkholderiales bacterium]|nr:glycosyltransferase family 2 protein [Burkholderiales bacterium]
MTHLVLIPTYNTGRKVQQTVDEARRVWQPVWVVVDGSTDGTTESLQSLAQRDDQIRVLVLEQNVGKGAAVLHGLRAAAAAGYTHALIMDADGQHPTAKIPEFMAASRANPDAQILGVPIFDRHAPLERVLWRKMSNFWVDLETLWEGVGDSLFGFRVYPIEPLVYIMERSRWMRRFDFDAEAAVRLCWRGVRPINIPVPVKYFGAEEGGVSHFRYWRDNLLLTWMHTRLFLESLARAPRLIQRRLRSSRH